jgi:hypothetical protein
MKLLRMLDTTPTQTNYHIKTALIAGIVRRTVSSSITPLNLMRRITVGAIAAYNLTFAG